MGMLRQEYKCFSLERPNYGVILKMTFPLLAP